MERRIHLLPALAAAALLVAACGGSAATTAPASSEAAPTEPAATEAAPTEVAPTDAGTGSVDFGDAATKLAGLDSYKFSVTIASKSSTASGIKAGTVVYAGTVNNKDKTQTLDILEKDEAGTTTSQSSFVLLPDKAYTKDGSATTWTEIPAAQAGIFTQAFAAFRPEQMFSAYWVPGAGDNTTVGTETKNGVSCVHLKADAAIGSLLSGLTGVSSSWSSDVWLASDGGYLVHSEVGATGADGTESGAFSIVIDITDVNGSNTITAPM